MATHLVVGNPTAQSGKNRERIDRALALLKDAGIAADLLATLPEGKTIGAVRDALKTIRAEYAHAATLREMFLDEAAILARLSHPGIATVHDFGEQDMELKTNTQLTREIHGMTVLLQHRLATGDTPQDSSGHAQG